MTEPAWIDMPALDPWQDGKGGDHGEHSIEAVSRHSIAETGLVCPRCGTEIGVRGDYDMVRRGRMGEVIKCIGRRRLQDGVDHTCNTYLVASPDTEHGDHLIWDTTPVEERTQKFHTFVRISKEDMLKEKLGDDIKPKPGDVLVADAALAQVKPVAPERVRFAFQKGEVYITSDGRLFNIERVQTDGDLIYDGWAWGTFVAPPPQTIWHLDPFGLIRQSMCDPTMNDTVRVISLSPPV